MTCEDKICCRFSLSVLPSPCHANLGDQVISQVIEEYELNDGVDKLF